MPNTFRVLHLSEEQQQVVKLHLDGKSDSEISTELDMNEEDVVGILYFIKRALPKIWKKSLTECFEILRRWNISSSLILLLCLAPAFDGDQHNNDRIRTPRQTRSKTARKREGEPLDLFDLFEIC